MKTRVSKKEEFKMQEGQSRFNYNAVAMYLCQQTGAPDVHLIDPFKNRIKACDIPRKTPLQVVFTTPPGTKSNQPIIACSISESTIAKGKSPQPPDPFINPKSQTPMQHDLNAVCVYNVTCRHYKLESPQENIAYAVRLNFVNEHVAALEETHKMRKMHAATGAVGGAFAYLTPTSQNGGGGKDINEIPMPELEFGYQNEQFTKTFMLVDESNFMNGVIQIPHDVCIAAGLPVWRGDAPDPDEKMLSSILNSLKISPQEKQVKREEIIREFKANFLESFKDDKKSTFFYAVPRRHVLAWAYGSESFMAQLDFKVEQFRFIHPTKKRSKLLYYLVPNAPFEDSIPHFKKAFLNKVDKKPLSSLGVEFIPTEQYSSSDVSIQLKAFFTYYSAPALNPETIRHLAPVLCKDFPLCHNWSKDEMEAQIAIERAQLQKEKEKAHRITKKN